jgi:hypothetical protein
LNQDDGDFFADIEPSPTGLHIDYPLTVSLSRLLANDIFFISNREDDMELLFSDEPPPGEIATFEPTSPVVELDKPTAVVSPLSNGRRRRGTGL